MCRKAKAACIGGITEPSLQGRVGKLRTNDRRSSAPLSVAKRRRPRTLAVLAGTSRARSRCNPSCQPTPRPVTDARHVWAAGRGGRGGDGRAHQLAKACSGPPTALPILQNRRAAVSEAVGGGGGGLQGCVRVGGVHADRAAHHLTPAAGGRKAHVRLQPPAAKKSTEPEKRRTPAPRRRGGPRSRPCTS